MQVLRKPDWLKIKIPSGEDYLRVKKTLRTYNLNTVCEESSCPNVSKCWESGTATIMIMGNMCTRVCRFCDVSSGRPAPLDPDEPKRVAEAIKQWNLRYIVITSVCRDDLEDGGAAHFAKTIKSVKLSCPNTIVEPLIPDFNYDSDSIKKIIESEPEVVSHNIETVRRLSSKVRDSRATYDQSLSVLRKIKEINPKIYTKSSFMVGHGETKEEVIQTASDLKSANVDVITAGQYLQPSLNHLPVVEYVHPEKFVRSSFQAADFIEKIKSVKRST
ncbi:MAG TPA: lipoyl synthase [Candidatus Nitrosopelagicus sp.]|nr:lipoyl synthase [Candidatus Nitrosopelagicus sp.]